MIKKLNVMIINRVGMRPRNLRMIYFVIVLYKMREGVPHKHALSREMNSLAIS
jgi:hypothetical protein